MESKITLESKIAFIREIFEKNDYVYVDINDPTNIDSIYIAFKDGVIDESNGDGLVNCYYGTSFEIRKNGEMAFHWYKKSAELENPNGLNNLGECYYHGFGVARDLAMAFFWFQKSANLGNSRAMNNLGYCYYKGVGVKQDHFMSFFWYQKSAELKNSDAMYHLGKYYEKNDVGQGEPDYEKALYWYQKSVELNNRNGMNLLGLFYRNEKNPMKDFDKAFDLFNKSVDLGNRNAIVNLASCYEHVKQDYDMAKIWYKKAADLGSKYGMKKLGDYHLNGLGQGGKNNMEAFIMYKMSADLGCTNARRALDKMCKQQDIIMDVMTSMMMKNNEMKLKIKGLEDENAHLKLYPGHEYRQAMEDFKMISEQFKDDDDDDDDGDD